MSASLAVSPENAVRSRLTIFQRLIAIDLFAISVRTVLFLSVAGNWIDIESTDAAEGVTIGFDIQAMLKSVLLVIAGVLGFVGWFFFREVRILQSTSIGCLATALCLLYFVTVPTSISPAVSLAAAVSFSSYVLLVSTALIVCGPDRIFRDIRLALFVCICMGWLAYYLVPEIGVWNEKIGGGQEVARMTGVAHPNTFGRITCLFIILCFVIEDSRRSWWLKVPLVAFGLITIRMTLSRTAFLACFVSLSIIYSYLLRHRLALLLSVPILFSAMLGVLYLENRIGLDRLVEKALEKTSKTQDASEIKSATGRTEIWSYTWKLIQKEPLHGYGASTSPILLKEHSSQAHNILLNVTLSFGFFGGVVLGLWLITNFYWILHSKNGIVSGVSIFVLVCGITENTILPTFTDVITIAWLAISFWPYLDFVKRRSAEIDAANSKVAQPVG